MTIIELLKRYPKGWNRLQQRWWGRMACLKCYRLMQDQEKFYVAPELKEYILCESCRNKLLQAARENKELVTAHALESEHENHFAKYNKKKKS